MWTSTFEFYVWYILEITDVLFHALGEFLIASYIKLDKL